MGVDQRLLRPQEGRLAAVVGDQHGEWRVPQRPVRRDDEALRQPDLFPHLGREERPEEPPGPGPHFVGPGPVGGGPVGVRGAAEVAEGLHALRQVPALDAEWVALRLAPTSRQGQQHGVLLGRREREVERPQRRGPARRRDVLRARLQGRDAVPQRCIGPLGLQPEVGVLRQQRGGAGVRRLQRRALFRRLGLLPLGFERGGPLPGRLRRLFGVGTLSEGGVLKRICLPPRGVQRGPRAALEPAARLQALAQHLSPALLRHGKRAGAAAQAEFDLQEQARGVALRLRNAARASEECTWAACRRTISQAPLKRACGPARSPRAYATPYATPPRLWRLRATPREPGALSRRILRARS